jgi:hypothetical protein
MPMKTFASLLTFAFALSLNSQITIHSTTTHQFDIPTEEITNSFDKIQTFNISLIDSLFIHNVFDENNEITDSQIYHITKIVRTNDLVNFTALSGISGLTYEYIVTQEDDRINLMQLFEEDQAMYIFDGNSSKLKTFNQP